MNEGILSFLQNSGIGYDYLPYVYWALVVLLLVFVFYVSNAVCHRGVIPLLNALTRKTSTSWDDAILNTKVLRNLSDLVPPILLAVV